jgi:hypothetical protein
VAHVDLRTGGSCTGLKRRICLQVRDTVTVSHQHLAQRERLVGGGHHKREGIRGQGPPAEGDVRGGPTISLQSGHTSLEGDVSVRAWLGHCWDGGGGGCAHDGDGGGVRSGSGARRDSRARMDEIGRWG